MNQGIMSVRYLNLWWGWKKTYICCFLQKNEENNLTENGYIILGLKFIQEGFFLKFFFCFIFCLFCLWVCLFVFPAICLCGKNLIDFWGSKVLRRILFAHYINFNLSESLCNLCSERLLHCKLFSCVFFLNNILINTLRWLWICGK